MQIINFKNLAKNDLRRKALLVAEAGYEAINISKVIGDRFKVIESKNKEVLIIKGQNDTMRFKLDDFKRVFVIGIGKGSALASLKLAKILGKRLTRGIALDVSRPTFHFPLSTFHFLVGTHPLPSKVNIAYTKKIIDLVKKAEKDDLIIFFICGGGSALLCGSQKELRVGQKIFKKLTEKGANILELNIVRKHISEVKGGGLAKMAYPATIVSLIVSDVLGNDLVSVASGPTVYDKTTKKNAEIFLNKYLRKSAFRSALIRSLGETPKDKKYFKKVKNILFVSNKDALDAMREKAEELGLRPKIYSLKLKGEAKNVFSKMMKGKSKKEAILAGGETTVNLTDYRLQTTDYSKNGKGGRNQESILGALVNLRESARFDSARRAFRSAKICMLAVASDGHDNTEAAGAIGDVLTIQKAKKLGLNPKDYLDRHDSFNFFKKTGDSIFAKKESFNVADSFILIKDIN